MVYDLVMGGGCRGVHRWDDFAARFPSEQEDTDWEKAGKSAAVLSVCATLVLNATLALPFNVAKQSGVDTRSTAFRAVLALDGVAFISAAVARTPGSPRWTSATPTYTSGPAARLVVASLAITAAFALGLQEAFTTTLLVLPMVAILLLGMVTLSGIIVPLRTARLHNRALRARLDNQVLRRRLRDNPRLKSRFCSRHRPYLVAAFVLVIYCIDAGVSFRFSNFRHLY
jgi:hypothetical protein